MTFNLLYLRQNFLYSMITLEKKKILILVWVLALGRTSLSIYMAMPFFFPYNNETLLDRKGASITELGGG